MMRPVNSVGRLQRAVGSRIRAAVRYGSDHHDDHHHGPALPRFAPQPPSLGVLPQRFEFVWDDGTAPELTVDFDAIHVDIKVVLASIATMFGVLTGIFKFCESQEREENRPVVGHGEVMPFDYKKELGFE